MRKQIFYSLVASALLVGCTADETIAPELGKGTVNLSERPSLGQLTFSTGGDATRIAIKDNTSFTVDFEDGDKFGACIVDAPKAGTITGYGKDQNGQWFSKDFTYWDYTQGNVLTADRKTYAFEETKTSTTSGVNNDRKSFYTINRYISTNYPFTKEGDVWTSPANMVEGNYFFYAPYSSNHLTRNIMRAKLPLVQDCSEGTEGSALKDTKYQGEDVKVSSKAIMDMLKGTDPFLVGYQFLSKESGNKPSVKSYNLYAYPMFTIVNDFNGWLFDGENRKGDASNHVGKYVSTQYNKEKKTMTIDKVEIYYNAPTSSPLFESAVFNFENAKNKLGYDGKQWDTTRFTTGSNTGDILDSIRNNTFKPAEDLGVYEPRVKIARRDGIYANGDDESKMTAYTSPVGSNVENLQNHIICNIGKTLKNGEKYHFHAVMPAGDYKLNLVARVYVTIDGKKYVMLTGGDLSVCMNDGSNPGQGQSATKRRIEETNTKIDDHGIVLVDIAHGSQNNVLIRGEHYPKAEFTINADGTKKGTKTFAGNALTIRMAGANAFQLNDEIQTVDNTTGLNGNAAILEYIENYIQRGTQITEVAADNTGSPWTAGRISLKPRENCVINKDFIVGLFNQTIVSANNVNNPMLTLLSNVPIAADVDITEAATTSTPSTDGKITFKATADGREYTYTIGYKNLGYNNSKNLTRGYNYINANVTDELVPANDAVVEVAPGKSVKVGNTGGIRTIYLNNGATLTVNGTCTARIYTRGSCNITINENGSLTNENNYLAYATITNNYLRTIKHTGNIGNVSATLAAWPTSIVSADTKVNLLTITANGAVTINQAQVDILQNLRPVAITLSNAGSIVSSADVKTTNIKSITATNSISWTVPANQIVPVTVTKAKYERNNKTSLNNIAQGGNVTIVEE